MTRYLIFVALVVLVAFIAWNFYVDWLCILASVVGGVYLMHRLGSDIYEHYQETGSWLDDEVE